MQTRLFTLGFGLVYTLVGVVGFLPALRSAPAAGSPPVDVTTAYGLLLGLFPVNLWHNLFHIAVGLIAIGAAARLDPARLYCRTLFLVFGLLTVLGFLPQANTLWGLLPIYGNDTWLHAATAVVAAYFGFVAPEPTSIEAAPAHG